MSARHRIVVNGEPQDFSCFNRRFQTDISRGFAHGWSQTRGSVVEGPLAGQQGEYSLWLEHVANRDDPAETDIYWLMWYDPEGNPTIPLSGILHREELADMVRGLMAFVPA